MVKKLTFLFWVVMAFAIISLFCIARLQLRVPAAKIVQIVPGWREDFDGKVYKKGKSVIPERWVLKGKLGTPPTVFTVVKIGSEKAPYLEMKAVKASGSLITRFDDGGLEKMPVLRWRWRAKTLPKNGDGRMPSKDDQAIAIYVGTGSMISQKSISYRWDTDTPKGSEGNSSYASGALQDKWFTLRNKDDLKDGQWFQEERNYLEDFKNAWGFYPKKVYLGIVSNSQYTASTALADLDWIELTAQQN